MDMSDLDRLLRATLPGQGGRMSVTLTDLPAHLRSLQDLLAKAAEMAELQGAPLVEIHLPVQRYPQIGAAFRNVPVRDCGRSAVLRFIYESEPKPA
ncbi:MAG: hypothetical protein RL735_1703 [Pseudomonadota bacterium]|jgi:hypothetical protein